MPIFNQVVSGGGTTPTGTKNITTNGTHDVAAYEYADVQVPTTAPTYYVRRYVDNNGNLKKAASVPSNFFQGIRSIEGSALREAFVGYGGSNSYMSGVIDMGGVNYVDNGGLYQTFVTCNLITELRWTALTNPNEGAGSDYGSCSYMCRGCRGIITLNLSSLQSLGINAGRYFSNAFENCTSLINVYLNSLETVAASNGFYAAFAGCTSLPGINLSSLKTVSGSSGIRMLFKQCTSIITQKFESLSSITGTYALGNLFWGATSLQDVWFYALNANSFGSATNQFMNMFSGCTGVTVHFPIAIQSTIGSWSDVTNGFGGTSTTVSFDIVTSLTGADSNTYTRQEKDSTSTATAWLYNNTLYYTSGVSDHTNGVNEPQVGDTIYSDAACTTAVTTISAIA